MTEGSPGFHGETQERLEFRTALRSLLDRSWSAQDARAYVDGSTEAFDKVAASLRRDMSLGGILVPEEYGGLGGSYGDAAVAAEELGATLFPHDLLGSWIASDALLNANSDDNADILKLLASEANAFLFAWPGQDPTWRLSQITTAQLDGGGVSGSCTFVPGARADATVLLPVSTDDGVGLGIVHAAANPDAVTYAPRPTTDLLRPIGDLTFRNAEGTVLGLAKPEEVFAHAVAVGAVLLAAEATGAARACLDATVAYGMAREQFGKQLITFQAVKHRVGAALIAVERARASVYRAAAKAEEGSYEESLDEFIMLARIAKTSSAAALRLAARESVQLHGAMGFTWENPSHLYLRRWSVTAGLYGKTDEHHELLYHYAQGGAHS